MPQVTAPMRRGLYRPRIRESINAALRTAEELGLDGPGSLAYVQERTRRSRQPAHIYKLWRDEIRLVKIALDLLPAPEPLPGRRRRREQEAPDPDQAVMDL